MLIILLLLKIVKQMIKLLNLKLMSIGISEHSNIFSKPYTENWWRDKFVIDFVSKTNSSTHKIKGFNGEKIIGNFYVKNNWFWVNYKRVIIQNQTVILEIKS